MSKKICNFAKSNEDNFVGVLAQLARAFDWQSKGQRFDSVILHKKPLNFLAVSFFYVCYNLIFSALVFCIRISLFV